MIVGAQKAGTTSIKNYLGQHPALQTHYQKEFAYFVDVDEYQQGYATALKKYFPRRDAFKALIGKSAGLYINEPAIQRLKEHNPDCKLVFILRNPIHRAYSSYLMEKNYGAIHESFEIIEEVVSRKDRSDWRYEFFIGMSLYCEKLETIYRHFPKEQVMLVRFEEIADHSASICQRIFQWLNVDDTFRPDTSVIHNKTKITRSRTYGKLLQRVLHNSNPMKKIAHSLLPGTVNYKVGEVMRVLNKSDQDYGPIPPKTLGILRDFFEPYNNQLAELTGIDFSAWNITQPG